MKSNIITLKTSDPIFNNIPSTIKVVRHHSLIVESINTNAPLMPLAYSNDDDILMIMKHNHKKHYGIQFHPESVGAQCGK